MSGGGGTTTTQTQTAAPTIAVFSNSDLQNGAVVVALAYTTQGSLIYYTVDGSTPTTSLGAIPCTFSGGFKPYGQGHCPGPGRFGKQRHQPEFCAQHPFRHSRVV